MTRRHSRLALYFFYPSALVVIVAGLKMASQVVIILFLSIFIASILTPLMVGLQRRGVPRSVALILLMGLIVGVLFVLAALLGASLEGFAEHLPQYEAKLKELLASGAAQMGEWGWKLDPQLLLSGVDLKTFVAWGGKAAGNVGAFLSQALLVLIGVGFILFEAPFFDRKLARIFRDRPETLENIALFGHTIQKYFMIKSFTSFLTGLAITITLIFFEIPYPVLWGFLGFLLNFIPVVGSLIAAIPALLLALFYKDLSTVLWLTVAYVVINNVISNLLEPKIMGEGLDLSPAVVFFSLIFWGWVLGPAGMFLAVPLTMTLKIALQSHPQSRWIATLLSNCAKGCDNEKGQALSRG